MNFKALMASLSGHLYLAVTVPMDTHNAHVVAPIAEIVSTLSFLYTFEVLEPSWLPVVGRNYEAKTNQYNTARKASSVHCRPFRYHV